MRNLKDCQEQIHSCSKCGLCQSVCPIYKITGNDCTVSRGHFIMLMGLIKGELRMTKTMNKYLDICLKCGACSKFCPSGIDVVDIISLAKAEYFKTHFAERIKSFFQKYFIFGLFFNIFKIFHLPRKSKKFEKKVLYFGGCNSKIKGNKSVIKILNSVGVEVVSTDFDCCGMPFYVRGDLESFEKYKNKFLRTVEKYGIKDIVTTCASCEKALKAYKADGINIRNIFEYMRENELKLKLKKKKRVTFHKPCNINNYDDIKWLLKNTVNLKYVEAEDFDKCCGFNGILRFGHYNIMRILFSDKHKKLKRTKAKVVLTSCLGCETVLKLFSFGKYKVKDLTEFLAKNTLN